MFRKLFFIAGLAAISNPALAETLFLDCELVDKPSVKVADLYAIVPQTRDIFMRDVWELGATAAILPPPNTWVIDTIAKTISSPEGNGEYQQTSADAASVEGRFLTDGGTLKTFALNRIDRSLKISILFAPNSLDDWKVAHGKPFPLYWQWRQHCVAAEPM